MNRRLLSWAVGVLSIVLIAVFAFIKFGSENDKRTGTTEDDDESTIVAVDREAPTKPDDQPALPSEPETQPSTTLGKSSEPDSDKQNNEDVSGTQPAVGAVSSPQAAAANDSDRATDNALETRLPTSPVADVDTNGVNPAVTPGQTSGSVERASELETIAGSATLAAANLDEGNRPSDNKPTTSSPEDLGTPRGVAASGSDDSPGGICHSDIQTSKGCGSWGRGSSGRDIFNFSAEPTRVRHRRTEFAASSECSSTKSGRNRRRA